MDTQNRPASSVQTTDDAPSGSIRSLSEKHVAGFISVSLVLFMLLPLAQNVMSQPRDCFPFSFYPMFSKRRSEQQTMRFVVARDDRGRQKIVTYNRIGRGGMNQVRKQIRNNVKQGDAERLCQTVARNIERSRSSRYNFATHVSIVTARYQLSDYVRGESTPTSWNVVAECPLPRCAARGRDE